MSRSRFIGLIACGPLLAACGPSYYAPPALPAEKLASVTVDSRARVLDIDGHPILTPDVRNPPSQLLVGPGCRKLSVKYEESFSTHGDKSGYLAGTVIGTAVNLGTTHTHDYQTFEPIQFFVPAESGSKYWVTATFTGERFIPRVVELAPNGDASGTILPDTPCPGASATDK